MAFYPEQNRMDKHLKGKRVLISGATSNIGAGIARAFAHLKADILLHYHQSVEATEQLAKELRQMGGEVSCFRADLRNEQEIEALFHFLDEKQGGPDVLINNAGILFKGSALETSAEAWDEVLSLNLRAPYLLSRLAAERMTAGRKGGTIINLSSAFGMRGIEAYTAYAASKCGLDALTRALALEWAPQGIRVNAIAPGIIPSKAKAEALKRDSATWLSQIPLGRFGQPADIGKLAVFLASEEAAWITGQSFVCDGGSLACSPLSSPTVSRSGKAPPSFES